GGEIDFADRDRLVDDHRLGRAVGAGELGDVAGRVREASGAREEAPVGSGRPVRVRTRAEPLERRRQRTVFELFEPQRLQAPRTSLAQTAYILIFAVSSASPPGEEHGEAPCRP